MFAVYAGFATELEDQSKQLQETVGQNNATIQGQHGDNVQSEYLIGRPRS